jgi:spore coat protein U-like protein
VRRIVLIVVVCLLVQSAGEVPVGAQGSTSTANLTVSANVIKNCTISTTPVNFGAYDPVAANATTPLNAIGNITVTCTKGAAAKVGLNAGGNAQGATRRMTATAAEFLTYELYKDAGRTQVWGNTETDGLDIVAAPSRDPRTFTAYGSVAAAQDATVGNYTDTVVATVNF